MGQGPDFELGAPVVFVGLNAEHLSIGASKERASLLALHVLIGPSGYCS